jgi:hypothetical protein
VIVRVLVHGNATVGVIERDQGSMSFVRVATTLSKSSIPLICLLAVEKTTDLHDVDVPRTPSRSNLLEPFDHAHGGVPVHGARPRSRLRPR